jgi:hypothetical protein
VAGVGQRAGLAGGDARVERMVDHGQDQHVHGASADEAGRHRPTGTGREGVAGGRLRGRRTIALGGWGQGARKSTSATVAR